VPSDEGRRHAAALHAPLLPPVPTEAQLQASLLHRQPSAASGGKGEAADVAMAPAEGEGLEALLAAMPPRPPGWKPGDPLPLPPPAAELRHVPRMELASLNPDLEFELVVEEEEDDEEEEE